LAFAGWYANTKMCCLSSLYPYSGQCLFYIKELFSRQVLAERGESKREENVTIFALYSRKALLLAALPFIKLHSFLAVDRRRPESLLFISLHPNFVFGHGYIVKGCGR